VFPKLKSQIPHFPQIPTNEMKDKELHPVQKFNKEQKKKAVSEKKNEKHKKRGLEDARLNPEKYIEKYNKISTKDHLNKQDKSKKLELSALAEVAKKEIQKREKITKRVEYTRESIDEDKRYEQLNRDLIEQQNLITLTHKIQVQFPRNQDKIGAVVVDGIPLPIGPKFILKEETVEYIDILGNGFYQVDDDVL
jgi:hypothetical protein